MSSSSESVRYANVLVSVLGVLDVLNRIEGLERINENFGLDVGDKIFALVAKACLAVRDEHTYIYRISGNKIALMNVSGKNARDAQELYSALKRKVSEIEYNLDYAAVFTISSGVVSFINDSSEPKDLLKKADFSLSMGKKSGKHWYTRKNRRLKSLWEMLITL